MHGFVCFCTDRSEWTIDPKCRAKYLPVQGELWFGFSIYIPKHVANGLKSDKKFLHKQSDDVAKRMNSEVHELLDTEGGKVEGERSGDWDFLTSERNWLDLFQVGGSRDLLARYTLLAAAWCPAVMMLDTRSLHWSDRIADCSCCCSPLTRFTTAVMASQHGM